MHPGQWCQGRDQQQQQQQRRQHEMPPKVRRARVRPRSRSLACGAWFVVVELLQSVFQSKNSAGMTHVTRLERSQPVAYYYS